MVQPIADHVADALARAEAVADGRDGVDAERVRVILALETSCDDTCAAVITQNGEIRSNVISSQGIHDRYGGVVPEIASRHHLDLIGAVVDDALATADTALDRMDLIEFNHPELAGLQDIPFKVHASRIGHLARSA